jgi:hypothetical protein
MTEAPSVEAAWKSAPENTSIVGVGWSGDLAIYQDFINEGGLTFPQIDDTVGSVYERFGIPYQPAAVLITPAGEVTTIRDAIDEDTLAKLLRS